MLGDSTTCMRDNDKKDIACNCTISLKTVVQCRITIQLEIAIEYKVTYCNPVSAGHGVDSSQSESDCIKREYWDEA